MTGPREAQELDLVFYVNGTLPDAEATQVEALLARDAELRAEHDALVAIRAEMQAEDLCSPSAFGLARLMRDVGRESAVAATPQATNRVWMWQLAAAVATVALLGQGLWLRGGVESGGAGGYQMASAAPSGRLTVTFAAEATEGQIRDLLLALDVEIVAGPSALGFYDLDVLEGGDHAVAVTGLRDAAGIIESVNDGAP